MVAQTGISRATVKGLDSILKAGQGLSGVKHPYHYHHHYFMKLPEEQHDELVKWITANKKIE
jgi:hypothetical protein